jgi:putative flippase GtrA
MFVAVGALGFVVQLGALAALTTLAHWSWLPATAVAVELAVVHNFVWHRAVTWRERDAAALAGFVRFTLSNGLLSILGNVVVMAICAGVVGMRPLLANGVAVLAMTCFNFAAADRWVFAPADAARKGESAHREAPDLPKPEASSGHRTGLGAALLLVVASTRLLAAPQPAALDAWQRYVSSVEAGLESAPPAPHAITADVCADGNTVQIESGSISDWRGSVFVRGVTVSDVLGRLQVPGTPPPQEDVLASRVIARGPDTLRVYIRMARHAVVTATYDTEHEMTFRRRSATLATARSIATRIEEVGGGDRGFLWRLNSYWRYEERDGGVHIDLRSLTLSRPVPMVIRPIAGPVVTRVARESMVRTLDALRAYLSRPS